MSEDIWPVVGGGGRTVDLLVGSPEAVFIEVMDAPDLEVSPPDNPPPADAGGDGLPERDWRLIAILAFGASFSLVSAFRFTADLIAELA